jgi:transposase-like protein
MMAVRWYLRYGLSYRDVEELLVERGIELDHVTIHRWVQRFTPLLIDAARPRRRSVGDRWFVDETYAKVAGRWRYVYRAIDQHGQVIDVFVSPRRNIAAARTFFTTALIAHGEPDEVVTDLAQAQETVIEELIPDTFHNTDQYATDVIVNRLGPVSLVASERPSPHRHVLVVQTNSFPTPELRVVVVVRGTPFRDLGRMPSSEFEVASLPGTQPRPSERVILVLRDQMPTQHRHLPSRRHNRHLKPSTTLDPFVKRSEWAWRTQSIERCLDQHPPGLQPASFRDPAVTGRPITRLTHPRVQPQIRDKPVRVIKPGEITDRSQNRHRHRNIDTRHRHQPRHHPVIDRLDRNVTLHLPEFLTIELELTQQRCDTALLINGHNLPGQPTAADTTKQTAMRTRRHQIPGQDGLHLVLQPGPLPHQMSPAVNQAAAQSVLRPALADSS